MFDIVSINSNIFLVLLLVAAGFVLIIYGGNFFVDSAVWLAKVSHIPEIIIGATIVSVGTTLPEMIVSFMAAGTGENAMAVGNSVGSVFCNTALILGLVLAFSSAQVDRKDFLPKYALLLFSVVLIGLFCINSNIELWESIILLALFAVFIVYSLWNASREQQKELGRLKTEKDIAAAQMNGTKPAEATETKKKAWVMILLFFLGAAGIAVGAGLLVDSVSALAEKANISQQIISLTVVAIGTSLPELITALTSLKKNNLNISLGNIIGADLINTTLIVGGSGVISAAKSGQGLPILGNDILSLIITLAGCLIVLSVLAIPIFLHGRTRKWQGIAMIGSYVAYLAAMILLSVL